MCGLSPRKRCSHVQPCAHGTLKDTKIQHSEADLVCSPTKVRAIVLGRLIFMLRSRFKFFFKKRKKLEGKRRRHTEAPQKGNWRWSCKAARETHLSKGSPLGVDGFPAVTVNAVDAAHVVRHGSNVIQVRCSVDLSAGVKAGIQAFFLGHTIGMREVHINVLGLIHLAFVGEEDLWLGPGNY